MKKVTKVLLQTVVDNDETIDLRTKQAIEKAIGGDKQKVQAQLFNLKDASMFLGISRVTCWKIIKDGYLKPVVLPSGLKRYKLQDLEKLAQIKKETIS